MMLSMFCIIYYPLPFSVLDLEVTNFALLASWKRLDTHSCCNLGTYINFVLCLAVYWIRLFSSEGIDSIVTGF